MTGSLGMTSLALMFGLISAQDVDYTTEPLAKIKAKVESKKAYLADVREHAESGTKATCGAPCFSL